MEDIKTDEYYSFYFLKEKYTELILGIGTYPPHYHHSSVLSLYPW